MVSETVPSTMTQSWLWDSQIAGKTCFFNRCVIYFMQKWFVKCVFYGFKTGMRQKYNSYYLLSKNLVNLGIIIVLSTVILQYWRSFLFCRDNFVEICKKHVLHTAKLLPYETNDHENPKQNKRNIFFIKCIHWIAQ